PIIYRPKGSTPHPTIIRPISEAVTPKISTLWRKSLSSRLPYRRHRRQNCDENSHKEGFYGESSTSSSMRQNQKIRVLTKTRQSYGTLMQTLSNLRMRRIS
ncbi:unnamed protein product, partial [Hymenolepis diminuta]